MRRGAPIKIARTTTTTTTTRACKLASVVDHQWSKLHSGWFLGIVYWHCFWTIPKNLTVVLPCKCVLVIEMTHEGRDLGEDYV